MRDEFRAAFWMIGAVLSFTSMAIAGRAVSFELDTFEIMAYRSIVGLVIVLAVAGWAGTLGQVRLHKTGTHLLRNISHFTGQNLWFYAITVVPLAQVFALEFTSPLWVMVLSALLLGERMTANRVAAALVGFVGILIVTRPSPDTFSMGLFYAGLAAIGFAGSAVFTRKLTRTETITSILLVMTAMQAVMGLICAGIDGDMVLPSAASLPWLLVIGMAGLTAHFCLTTALSLAPAALIMPMDFVRLPVIATAGMLIYGEELNPWVLLGAVLIFAANYANIWYETRGLPRRG